MKLFLIWAANRSEISGLIDGLQQDGHEILYWVGTQASEEEVPQGTVFHSHIDAWDGLPAKNVDVYDFPPPSKALIDSMHRTESLVLTMMNKRFDTDCVDKRRHRYYIMLQYWHGLLEKHKPDAIIFPTVPHTVYNYILYALAKRAGIKTIMFEDSWVSDRLLTYCDWEQGSPLLQEKIALYDHTTIQSEDLSRDIGDYYQKQTDSTVDSTPIYMTHWKKQFTGVKPFIKKIKKLIKSILDGSIIQRGPRYFVKQFKPNLEKEYARVVELHPDLDHAYVYVPLNFQPERTTSPQGDIFVDQTLMIETLAASLPKGWRVYVKEHPSQWWLRSGTAYSSNRYPGYYKQLAQIPRVQLVPIHMNSFTLSEKAKAVATVTGTAGWEATIRKKPVLIFGYPWYRDFPKLFRIADVESCKAALRSIADGFSVTEQDVLRFLKAFDDATVHAYVEGFVDKISELSFEESMAELTGIIVGELKASDL
ncbi:MAG: hypothetical protein COU35_03950 [Candidatus Magasanikbacteria bacterium CG10_big_fil_rev_8_21_14_0_10_47_10]|uniref:Capsular biosynthesis protein n=1 Tax=Candidatus Magasanikbacteria bacterium CG10_big_fil_rev_8_21_14_0_10_47_10 TaxID=1974652 RepID=A0A2H0TPX2_9BACT|nr:MAG: hypothetical protein COU35_03950 [Candidatus Magasanikbacteria bacterium CG10_big_fil_rev_8_21_14_0_10_47_10]